MNQITPSIALLALFTTGCASTLTTQNVHNEVAPFSAQGWGGTTCKELIHDITPQNVGFNVAVQNIHLYQSWASGFVSGVNYENKNAYDVSGGTAPEDTFAWLKNYCSNNMQTAIPIALHELLITWEQEGKAQATREP